MIQFNLLPDVKQQYIKARRQKHSVIVISLLTAAAALFIFIMLFLTVHVFQKQTMKGLDNDIAQSSENLKNTKDLDKILTIQNQLKSLPDLHNKKPVTSRLFTYLTQLTPAQVSIASVELDYNEKTLSLAGTADSLSTVNKFIDTLKFSTFSATTAGEAAGTPETDKPFSDVVLSSFAKTDTGATYQISFTYKEIIFDSSKSVALTVPKIISSRSQTEKPTELFQALPTKANQ